MFKPEITVKKITSDDTGTIEKIYRLRYQVYREERGYIDKTNTRSN